MIKIKLLVLLLCTTSLVYIEASALYVPGRARSLLFDHYDADATTPGSQHNECKVPDDEGNVNVIKKNGQEVARLQFETTLDGDNISIGAVHLCIDEEVLNNEPSQSDIYDLTQPFYELSYFLHYGTNIYTITDTCDVPSEGTVMSIFENEGTVDEELVSTFQLPVTFEADTNEIRIGVLELCLGSNILGDGDSIDMGILNFETELVDPYINSQAPTSAPSMEPSLMPSGTPSQTPTGLPTGSPTGSPTTTPSFVPSKMPSDIPSETPTALPSGYPTSAPSLEPTLIPSDVPSRLPSSLPSYVPSDVPSRLPSFSPSIEPSSLPSYVPSDVPSRLPSRSPSHMPSSKPSSMPSLEPSSSPSAKPSSAPSSLPSYVPSYVPSRRPSLLPSIEPSSLPSYVPSDAPTALPSGSPTLAPSDMPSYTPTVFPTVSPDSFRVSFTNVTRDFSNYSIPTIVISFDMGENKLSDLDFSYLDSTCNVASEIVDNSLYKLDIDYNVDSKDSGVIYIGLDIDAIVKNEDLFSNDVISFCVRADMTGRSIGFDESVTYTETVVILNFDMAAGFEMKDVSLEGIEAMKVNKTESFNVDACICSVNGNKATCLAKKLKQNSEFDLCIFSLLDIMEIDSLTSMEMEQSGKVKFSPIVNSKANPFTQVYSKQSLLKQDSKGAWKMYNAARVSSRVVSPFFVDKKLDPVIIKGSVLLAFAAPTQKRNRKLLENVKETEESQFATKVLLDDGSAMAMMKAETTEYNSKSNILNLVAIIAACVAVIAFAIVVYLKKKN